MKQNFQRYAVIAIIIIWGGISFFVLGSEDAPGQEMSLTFFLVSKMLALVSLYGCGKFYQYMERKGIIPEVKEEDIP